MLKPTLCVLDGTVSMMTNGPTGGSLSDLKETGTLVVSTDPVAADAVGVELLGRSLSDVPYILMAGRRARAWPTITGSTRCSGHQDLVHIFQIGDICKAVPLPPSPLKAGGGGVFISSYSHPLFQWGLERCQSPLPQLG